MPPCYCNNNVPYKLKKRKTSQGICRGEEHKQISCPKRSDSSSTHRGTHRAASVQNGSAIHNNHYWIIFHSQIQQYSSCAVTQCSVEKNW